MNPNPFGSAPGGGVQGTSATSFEQKTPNSGSQNVGVFQPSAFGVPSATNQPSNHGSSIFGQSSAFGQQSTKATSLPSSTPAFSQPTVGVGNFGSTFGAVTGANPSFGQTPALGQPSVFGQGPGFGQKVTGSGLFSGPASSSVQHQPLSFGQSLFGRPSTTGVASSVFGATPTQSSGFVPEFSFKPANEVLFKPIFSGSSEPTNPQTSLMSSSPFGGATKKTSFTASSGAITDLLGAKSGSHGFSFSEPAAAPSLPVQNNPLTAKNTGPSSMLQFTFSQPAVPSSSNTNAPITQPKTVPTFSFSSKALQPQTAQLSAGTSIVQPSSFGEIKSKAESTSDHKVAQEGEPNVFAPFRKGMKRRDEPTTELSSNVTDVAEDEETAETSSPRQPPKRPNIRSRVPAMNLFTRALSGLRKDKSSPVRQGPNETLQLKSQEMSDQPQVLEEPLTATTFGVQTMSSVVPEKTEESESPKTPEMTAETRTPIRSGVRSDSLDSLSGMSPTDCTVIQCRNIPPALNKRNILEKHFARFGKVCKVFCRPGKNMAAVHFDNHASAAKAKKKGKYLHRKELLLLWQKKKSSPGDKSSRPTSGQKELEGAKEDTSFKAASSPLRRPVLRPPAGSTFSLNSVVKKPLLTRSLQFDTEHQKENVMEMQSTKCVVPCAILPLIGVMAETSEDKYRLLEQRDKILRQDRTKNADMDLAKVFVGTCPDMCPEKERYMRETRNQLSMYEVHANTEMVNHAAAIKEYSRSSADQEEPLPHELRPLTVLSMTMDYLVTQVIDQCPDNLQDWYDFFWNRTRAIRKDITQQRLCCPHTVSLIEKCTRFHIHCSHHLCEQPMSVFEPKINNENLTKCLQSLKEMYEDLKDCNIYCPGEAEFRQYSVLLNLNDGDILRQVQQLRDEVRNSSEVHFAVQAFAALNSNNFVRFFKLVKKASYLASCLLHIYFNQVRAKALKILNIAHTVGPRSTAFPVEDIVRILMFRSTTEAIDFIQQYNLNVNDGLVDLNRIAYQEPELLSQKKSDIILAKRSTLTGELVNGGTLPNPPQHVPVCSFDAQNKFREGIMAEPAPNPFKAIARVEVTAPPSVELQPQVSPPRPPEIPNVFGMQPAVPDNTEKSGDSFHSLALPADAQQPFQPISQPPQVKSPSPAPPPQPVFSEEDITAEVDCLIEEIVGISAREVAADGAFYVTTALVESSVQSEALLSDVLGRLLEELSSSELHLEQERVAEEKRKIEEARRKQEHEAFVAMFRLNLYTEIMLEVLDETIKDIATTVFQQAVNEKAQCVAKCSQEVCTGLIEETLKADIALLVEDILTSELQRAHKYIQRWRDVVAVRRQLKRQMRGFPAAPCFVDPRFKLKALAPSAPAQQSIEDLACGMVNLGNGGRLSFSSTRVLKTRQLAVHQMKVQCYYQQLLEELVWSPLDLPALVAENTHKKHNRIFWKAVVLLPSDHENVASPASRILSDWLVVKLGGGQESKLIEEQRDGTLQTLHLSNTIKEKEQHTFEVNVSVKVSRGPLTEDCLSEIEECLDLQGTGALIMLLPAIAFSEPRRDELDVTLLSALLQLKQLQQASAWHCPVPLVILVPGTCNAETLEEELMLPSLVKDGFISEYKLLFIPETTNDMQGAKQLNSAIRWLLSRAPPSIPLCCQTLMHLVEASLSHEFSRRVSAAWAATGLSPQDPAPVVELYNAVIRHIADKVSSEELSGIAWPPGEFSLPDTREFVPHLGWNSGPHLAWLRRLILSLQLPQWRQLSTTDTWSELCSGIYIYAAQIPVTRGNQPLIMSRLESLLERVRRKEHHRKRSALKKTLGFWNEDHNTECSAYSQIPWVDVLFICIDHKLKDWQVPGPPVCEDAVTDDGEILVYYLRESLKGFQPPEEWIKAVRLSHRVKQQDDGASSAASATPTSWLFRQGLFTSLVEPLEAQTAPLDASYTPTRVEALSHRVLHTLEEEKTESKRTTEQLQHWLDGDSLDNWCTPLLLPSSILLSMPTALKQGPPAKHRDALYTKEASTFVSAVKEEWPRTSSSLTERLKHLQQQVRASQEEESACRLKLSAMMSIVED
ncbi:germinal-center associated nuclear protein [Nerophis lumbriciformis]|uniref:germinal-center associated nuclear protein n=1 Tax=Nerophis lumbriciformis TaxID=546530 RepID=UPI002ADF3EC0|nr:germinal-center associated nuclear protein-like [Nerophis lumbriciformis]XP_061838750.1 germinal-center associated nuclear protein-like [Nerophis lumbriciformis]